VCKTVHLPSWRQWVQRFVHHRPVVSQSQESVPFRCNICGAHNLLARAALEREGGKCAACGSWVRARAVVDVLLTELIGRSVPLSDVTASCRHFAGIGMSCWDGYAVPFAELFNYTNTFYHRAPFLDISRMDGAMDGTLDFVISSDVFEHVAPPVSQVFRNTCRLLKANGLLVLTVPFDRPNEPDQPTIEHFPDLFNYEILARDTGPVLRNVTRAGAVQEFRDLIFHGGPGQTLEMRLFSEWALLRELEEAGFRDVRIHRESKLEFGIDWQTSCSLPITARRDLR
jgi:hypothetical protein